MVGWCVHAMGWGFGVCIFVWIIRRAFLVCSSSAFWRLRIASATASNIWMGSCVPSRWPVGFLSPSMNLRRYRGLMYFLTNFWYIWAAICQSPGLICARSWSRSDWSIIFLCVVLNIVGVGCTFAGLMWGDDGTKIKAYVLQMQVFL